MTVVFFQLAARDIRQCGRGLASLVRKQVEAGRRVALAARDAQQARWLDDLLWEADEGSFVPHSLLSDATSPLESVVIAAGGDVPRGADVYVNLADAAVPEQVLSDAVSAVVYEFVPADAAAKVVSRQKWSRYKELKLETKAEKWREEA